MDSERKKDIVVARGEIGAPGEVGAFSGNLHRRFDCGRCHRIKKKLLGKAGVFDAQIEMSVRIDKMSVHTEGCYCRRPPDDKKKRNIVTGAWIARTLSI